MNQDQALPPEAEARVEIDRQLVTSGWCVQSRDEINLSAGTGVAIREFPLTTGAVDYLLFVNRQAVGVLEAKKVGHTLSGVAVQATDYTAGLPPELEAPVRPLPFCYMSTGVETQFANLLDPHPRSRRIFQFHRPETLADWLQADTLNGWVTGLSDAGGLYTSADDTRPSTLRARLQTLPPLAPGHLYPNQIRAVTYLEQSLKDDRPRALIQMATGSGKTIMAVTSIYRLIKFAGAGRILFLVDRGNLAIQAEKEFAGYRSTDDNRLFTELYNVQRLVGNTIGSSSKVVISTIQRLYSMLKGEELDPEQEEASLFEQEEDIAKVPLPVVYNAAIPPEYFDVIVIDECHRSIYSIWRQILDYFDAYLIGLTATPAKHTFGFFNQNLVMEYGHEEAVADGVNCDFEIYRIRTRITAEGATIEAEGDTLVGVRDRQTRSLRWERPDEDVSYTASDLDKNVVAKDQIRLIVRTFRDKLPTEIFPGRREVPKTLIFAKDDSHAEDIVEIIREEFGRGNEFCQKITYKTTGRKPSDLIQEFRNGYQPRIVVTVDMIATGTDIKPVEVVMFMRTVKSRVLFEQMKGRGVRVIDPTTLKSVTPDAGTKTHFVIVDCVGITEGNLADTQPLERKKTVSFKKLLEHVAVGGTDPDYLSSLASRLARLDKKCGHTERARIAETGDGADIGAISRRIVLALDPDHQAEASRQDAGLSPDVELSEAQLTSARRKLLLDAAQPLAFNPALRDLLIEVKKAFEQIIDEITKDELTAAGYSAEARERARALVQSFEQFLQENRDEIEALEFFYAQPYGRRLSYRDIKTLHEAINAPPRSWTPEKLWAAYQSIEVNKVRGASSQRRLTDIVSLIRYALRQHEELVPYTDHVHDRFSHWLAQQESKGRAFTQDQLQWLKMIRDHVAQSLEVDVEDFSYTPFVEAGGLGRASEVFGDSLGGLIAELNEVLAA